MKNVTATRDVYTRGTLDTSSAVAMGIDAAGMRIVLDTLSNMYSNGYLAVVREYSCNARDAHVEAGNTDPVIVKLPTPLDPQLKVQDFGTGLDKDQVLRVYAQYGASTKRDSNAMIGAFGIGSKSAFTVANHFTVTAIKEGEKTVALFSMTSDGPTVQILQHTFDVDEPNGVLVDIPIDNIHAVRDAAEHLFRAWPKGTVLVDGKTPESLWDHAEEVAKGIYIDMLSPVSQSQRFKVIMGGVPYNIPPALWNELPYEMRNFITRSNQHQVTYLFNVSIGQVDITPSREELKVTPQTVATVRRNVDVLRTSLAGWMSNKLDAAKNLWEASRVFSELVNKLGHEPNASQTYYKSQSLAPQTVEIKEAVTLTVESRHRYSYGKDNQVVHTREGWAQTITASAPTDVLFVTGVDPNNISIVKRHAKIMIQDDDSTFKKIVVVPDDKGRIGWFDYGKGADSGVQSMDYEVYRTKALALRKAMANGKSPRSKTQYEVYLTDKTATYNYVSMTADELNNSGRTLYYALQGDPLDFQSAFAKEIFKGQVAVVKLTGAKKLDVLEKNVPGLKGKRYGDVIKAKAKAVLATMTPEEEAIFKAKSWLQKNRHNGIEFLISNQAQITNKAVHTLIDPLVKARKGYDKKHQDRIDLLTRATNAISGKLPASDNESLTDLLRDKLPLLMVASANSWYGEHELGSKTALNQAMIDYVNNTPV